MSNSPEVPGKGLKRKGGCIAMRNDNHQRVKRCGNGFVKMESIRDDGDHLKMRLEDEYAAGEVIGKGQFGIVTKLKEKKRHSQTMACKTVRRNTAESVEKEIEIMRHLPDHPHIAALHAVFEEGDCVRMVMEYCGRGTLKDCIPLLGFKEREAACILRQVMEAVKHCHDMGVVHRDIKPHNILVATDERGNCVLKLTDFGLSTRMHTPQHRLTGTVGSPYYMAPEIIKNQPYSEKADIWSSGILLHMLLFGTRPFTGKSESDIFKSITDTEINTNSQCWSHVSPSAKELLCNMLTKDPQCRPSAHDVLRHPWTVFYTQTVDSPRRLLTESSMYTEKDPTPEDELPCLVKKKLALDEASAPPGDSGQDEIVLRSVDSLTAAISDIDFSKWTEPYSLSAHSAYPFAVQSSLNYTSVAI